MVYEHRELRHQPAGNGDDSADPAEDLRGDVLDDERAELYANEPSSQLIRRGVLLACDVDQVASGDDWEASAKPVSAVADIGWAGDECNKAYSDAVTSNGNKDLSMKNVLINAGRGVAITLIFIAYAFICVASVIVISLWTAYNYAFRREAY